MKLVTSIQAFLSCAAKLLSEDVRSQTRLSYFTHHRSGIKTRSFNYFNRHGDLFQEFCLFKVKLTIILCKSVNFAFNSITANKHLALTWILYFGSMVCSVSEMCRTKFYFFFTKTVLTCTPKKRVLWFCACVSLHGSDVYFESIRSTLLFQLFVMLHP